MLNRLVGGAQLPGAPADDVIDWQPAMLTSCGPDEQMICWLYVMGSLEVEL